LISSDGKNIDGYTRICSLQELKNNKGQRFIIDEIEIAIFKIEANIYALSNICPHQHTKMIYDGFIEKGCVVCPVHGWMFDLRTGNTPEGGKGLTSYETKIMNDNVYAKISKKELKW
jgi:3-phenylpropionate/trans-cinnamate dioxygenase ferredoxin component